MRESSRTPATATSTTSHHPACTGFPPRRTRPVSTGRRTGSVTLRRVRPTPPNGDTRRVRTSQPASATSAARQKAANTRTRRIVCTSYTGDKVTKDVGSGEWYLTARSEHPLRTIEYHSPLPTPLGYKDVHPVRLGEPRSGAAPDDVDPAVQRGRAQTVPGDGQGRPDAPPVRRRIVDLVVVKHGRASLAAERVDATVEHGGGESAAPRGHGGLPRPAVAGGVVGLDDVEVAARVEWAPADRIDQAARGGRGEVIARRGDRRGVLPAMRPGIVDRRGVEQDPSHTPPAHHDELAAHDAHAGCAPRLGERRARLPAVPVFTVDPQVRFRDEARLRQASDGVQRVARDGQRHVVPGRGEIGDAFPPVRRRVVAVGGCRGAVAAVDAASDVDLAVQDGRVRLLDRFGEGRAGGPVGATRCEPAGGEGGKQSSHGCIPKGVGSGEWYSTVRSRHSDRTVRYHSPLPTFLPFIPAPP